jgi:hypothetical protein
VSAHLQSNPNGKLTNSNLELIALIVGATLAAKIASILHSNILIASDNTPAIIWTDKG